MKTKSLLYVILMLFALTASADELQVVTSPVDGCFAIAGSTAADKAIVLYDSNDTSMSAVHAAWEAGKAVICKDGKLFNGTEEQLAKAIETGDVAFHEGRICGAWPQIATA